MKKIRSTTALLLLTLAMLAGSPSVFAEGERSPYLAGLLGELFPGGGYFYNGDISSGALASLLTIPLAAPLYSRNFDSATRTTFSTLGFIALKVHGYTVYDAFQDALDDESRAAQVISLPRYTFKELYLSPFTGSSYASWKVWLGIGAAAALATHNYLSSTTHPTLSAEQVIFVIPTIVSAALLVGLSEEAEYRGFQFPAFSQLTRSPEFGATLSSVSFGISHFNLSIWAPYALNPLFRATSNVAPYSTYRLTSGEVLHAAFAAAFGGYAAWLTATEPDGLRKAVTVHGIWDSLIFLSTFLSTGEFPPFSISASFPIPFL